MELCQNLTWERLLDWLETWLRDLAWLLHDLPETELLNQDQLPALRKCLQRYSSEAYVPSTRRYWTSATTLPEMPTRPCNWKGSG